MGMEVSAPCMSCGSWRSRPPRSPEDGGCASPRSHHTPEPHQVWVLLGGKWEIRGTGATHPFVEEAIPCEHKGHGTETYVATRADGTTKRFRGHNGGDAEWLYTFVCSACEHIKTRKVCDDLKAFLTERYITCTECGAQGQDVNEVCFFTPLED